MDTSLTSLFTVQQSGSLPPVDGVSAHALSSTQAASVIAAEALPANNDVIELSSAARLLSAASSAQNINSTPNNQNSFASVFNAALNFVSAFNSLNSDPGTNTFAPTSDTTGISGGIFDTSPGLNGTDLLLQALTDTPLNTTASGGNASGTSLLIGLNNIGISFQDSLLTGAALNLNAQTLENAFTSNPAGTTGILAQATASFAPVAANLVAQSNDLFLTQDNLAATSLLPDIFSSQLDLQLATANPAAPSVVAQANATLQRTLADEALGDAITATQIANPADSALANAGSAVPAPAVQAPTAVATTASTAPVDSALSSTTDTATAAAAAAVTAQVAQASANLLVTDAANAVTADNATQAQNPVSAPDTQATQAALDTQATLDAQNNQTIQNQQAIQDARDIQHAQDIRNAQAIINAQAAQAALDAENAIEDAQAANANNAASSVAATGNTTQAGTISAPTAAAPATTVTTDITEQTVQNPAVPGAGLQAATTPVTTATPATATTETVATAANPDLNPSTDPAFAAAIAAYNLRTAANNIIDTRGNRDLGNTVVDAVNSVESTSATPPTALNVHDEVAAAQRNELLRNTAPRAPSRI
ncbi:MAG: hypothetical protein V4634_08620 [Pseudomonadota bacterium]